MKKILTLIGIALIAINGITLVQAEQRCWTCNGSGTCNACFGTGKKDCNVCFGTGRTKCFNCSGIGYSLGAEFPDGTTASTRVVRVPCPNCNGAGNLSCTACNGQGKSECFRCNSSGRCSACRGTGNVGR